MKIFVSTSGTYEQGEYAKKSGSFGKQMFRTLAILLHAKILKYSKTRIDIPQRE